ncbi:hypothetical protein FXO37_35032 [Capsicum annuum]|nr:hypothetical protein FXO37_35032 [Capsicum annuum]
MVDLIKKELTGAITIRRVVRQGQPNVETLHDQPTEVDPSVSSDGVVGVAGRHVDAAATRDDEHVDTQEKINMFENRPRKPSDAHQITLSLPFPLRLADYDRYEYVVRGQGERPNPHDKRWTEAKKILAVMNVDEIHYRDIEILLKEGKINVYDCNEPTIDEVIFYLRAATDVPVPHLVDAE